MSSARPPDQRYRLSFADRAELRSEKTGRNECEPTIFVDGIELAGRTRSLDGLVDITTVIGVEVYPIGAEVPMQFLSDGRCGAVMIWTRRK